MRIKKILRILIIAANILGIICLIYLAVPLITHDTYVANPDAMLPMERWDGAGCLLTIGCFPMITANTLAFDSIGKDKSLPVRFLWLLPSAVCLALTALYLAISFA